MEVETRTLVVEATEQLARSAKAIDLLARVIASPLEAELTLAESVSWTGKAVSEALDDMTQALYSIAMAIREHTEKVAPRG